MRVTKKKKTIRSELVDAAVYNNLKTELYHSFSDEDISVLKHHGILGMKWGVRRYQNEDGTLTEEGKRRYKYSYSADSNTKPMIYEIMAKDPENKDAVYRKRTKKELEEYDRKEKEQMPTRDPNKTITRNKWEEEAGKLYNTLNKNAKLSDMISNYFSGEKEYSGEKYIKKMTDEAIKYVKSNDTNLTDKDAEMIAVNYVLDNTW